MTDPVHHVNPERNHDYQKHERMKVKWNEEIARTAEVIHDLLDHYPDAPGLTAFRDAIKRLEG